MIKVLVSVTYDKYADNPMYKTLGWVVYDPCQQAFRYRLDKCHIKFDEVIEV